MPTTSRRLSPSRSASGPPERLPWTGRDEADRLIAADGTALLIGFVLDQQVTVQKAFHGPLVIRERLGTIDASAIAAMDIEAVRAAFITPPAIHRFPGSMAERVHALCHLIATEWGGDGAAVWSGVSSAEELEARLIALPGFGPMKARTVFTVLAKLYGIQPPGWQERIPPWMTLGDASTAEALAEYQAKKRAFKAEQRALAAAAPKRPGRGDAP